MRVGSCFAGIGGFDLGLEAAGLTPIWQIELEPFQRSILARHWPEVARYAAIEMTPSLPKVDLICGGFPCQDISVAGKQAGLVDGTRSRLWFEMLRVVREVGPRWVLVENSPALRTRGADEVLGGLEALGYACWPLVVGACHVGAGHRRDRVWIVAYAGESRCEGEEHPVQAGRGIADLAGDLAYAGIQRGGPEGEGIDPDTRGNVADPCVPRFQGNGSERILHPERPAHGGNADGRRRALARHWPAGPLEPQHAWEPPRAVKREVGRGPDGVSYRLAERRRKLEIAALGAAVVPQIPEAIGLAILEVERQLKVVGQDVKDLLCG